MAAETPNALGATWYYLDTKERSQQGPVFGAALVNKAIMGEVKGDNLVYACPHAPGSSFTQGTWVKLADVKELQDVIIYQSQASAAQQQQYGVLGTGGDNDEEEDEQERAAKEAFLSGSDVAVSLRKEKKSSASSSSVGTKRGREKEVGNIATSGNSKASKKTKHNWVYVTGLPGDITEEEIMNHFTKVGILATNAHDQTPKIKLYRKEDGTLKGDCSVCYHSPDSVALALSVLDGGYIRLNNQITVIKADFQSKSQSAEGAKEEGNTKLNSSSSASSGTGTGAQKWERDKPSASQVKVMQAAQKQALSWNEDDDGGGVRKRDLLTIIVLEQAFDPVALAGSGSSNSKAELLKALERRVATACGAFGEIDKITVYSKHPDGVVIVRYRTNYAAQQCRDQLNGQQWVPGSSSGLRVLYWDGKTDYSVDQIDNTSIRKRGEGDSDGKGGGGEDEDEDGSYADLFEGYEDDELPEDLRLRTE